MRPLPIDPHLPQLIESLRSSRAAVLVAPPGSGKTTRVPPALLASGCLDPNQRLVLLQPRRVAARAATARIAEEQRWHIGDQVGYHIRFERRFHAGTRLRVLTEGVLTRQLRHDPYLEGVGAVVLDEFHERSLDSDLALAFLRELRETIRPDLHLIVMSATLDASAVARFLGDCPIIQVEAPAYPVDITYLPPRNPREPLEHQIETALDRLLSSRRPEDRLGDTLVFLPGMREIRRAANRIAPLATRAGLELMTLHGSMPMNEQQRVLEPADRPKLILATNVAETSLTIDGVTTVIDSGLARYPAHDPTRALDRLDLGKISQASAQQRAGRAGRTAPGRCIRLWAERDHRARPEFDRPEIHNVDLAATVLSLHAWGYRQPKQFPWFEPPSAEAIQAAETLLTRLGALHQDSLTTLGERMLSLPLHPRLARLLIAAADLDRLEDGAALAALLSERDIRRPSQSNTLTKPHPTRRPEAAGSSDLLERLDELQQAEADLHSHRRLADGLDRQNTLAVLRVRNQLIEIAKSALEHTRASHQTVDDAPNALLRVLLAAYPDRVARRRAPGSERVRMVGGRGARLAVESIVRDTEFLLAIDVREQLRSPDVHREALITQASAILPDWLESDLPQLMSTQREVRFDPQRGRAIVTRSLLYADLPLRTDTESPLEPALASQALAHALAPHAEAILRQDEAVARWLDRIAFARSALPHHDWPELSTERLAELLQQIIVQQQFQSLAELKKAPLLALCWARFDHNLKRTLDREVPESLVVPSGSTIQLQYQPHRPPVLAARLQELFGWHETPRIAQGRVPVLLHLLAPNFRPVQVTDDIRSFWTNTYHHVRKDLRARYPKHRWPEDPWTAEPEAKGGRRKP